MSGGPDPTLVPIFEAEVAEIVGTLQEHLLRLEQGAPDPAERLSDMLRLTHDVKGSARVVGYQRVAHLAHAFESRLQHWRGVEVVAPAEIGLGLAACDLLSQLTVGREAPELVARADELACLLEVQSLSGPTPTLTRSPAMRVVQAAETLRVTRERIDVVVDGAAYAMMHLLAGADSLAELKRVSHVITNLRLPSAGASRHEVARVQSELEAASTRMREAVQHMALVLGSLDGDVRCVDESVRNLWLVPFEPVATHLERVARDTAAEVGREVVFLVEGRDKQIDKELADAVKGPLTHAVRNAVDHGIEPPAERELAGKPRSGTLTLSLVEDDQSLRLTLSDDGRGVDRAAVRARLGAAAEGLDDRQLLATLLQAGISTRETVTEISGRGVGLSSLAAVAEKLRGDATLRSEAQHGTTLELRLPLRVSLLHGLPVRAAGCNYIVPTEGLISVRTPCATAVPLAEVLGLPGGEGEDGESSREANGNGGEVVMLRGRHGVAGITVDRIGSIREVVRRPIGAHLGRAPFVEGVTILGDGEPALILDPREVADACPQAAAAPAASPEPAPAGGRHVLVVDDSLTLRASLNASLVKAGFQVSQAGDGLAALALLGRTGCDAIVSDVQMPRMDGWQLLQHCAGRVPFVLMTARPEPDGAQRARQLGACAYLSKDDSLGERVVTALHTALSPFQESYP